MNLTLEIALRLGFAFLLGALVGAEREMRDQPAGLRTHSLVCLGAALFGVISVHGFASYTTSNVPPDPSRVAAQVVTGIGFLGAGAILRMGATVRGLTTAASLWVVAAIGLAAGIGMYLAALIASVGTVGTLLILRAVRTPLRRLLASGRVVFKLEIEPDADISRIFDVLCAEPVQPKQIEIDDEGSGRRNVTALVRFEPRSNAEDLAVRLSAIDGVRSIEYLR